jgi:hypothetical protein
MPDITARQDRKEVRIDKNTLAITRRSMFTQKVSTVNLPMTVDQEYAWRSNTSYIQDSLPHLSSDQREFLLTGAGPDEWNEAFPDEDGPIKP